MSYLLFRQAYQDKITLHLPVVCLDTPGAAPVKSVIVLLFEASDLVLRILPSAYARFA